MYNQKIKGNMLLLLTAFIWGLSFISQSKGVETVPPIAFNGIRSLLGGLVLLPVIWISDFKKSKKVIKAKEPVKPLLLSGAVCGILLCIATTLQTVGMVQTSPGKAGFITALYMVIVPVIGLFFGKKPTLTVLISVLIAVLGMYFMCIKPGTFSITYGDFLIFLCAFVFALHIMAIDYFSPKVDGVKLACTQFLVCGTINIIWMLFDEIPSLSSVLGAWIAIGYSGVFSCGIAYTLQIVGQKYTDPTSASILMSLESVFATLSTVVLMGLGWNLTGGALTAREILGCILMFAAIILVQLPENPKGKSMSSHSDTYIN